MTPYFRVRDVRDRLEAEGVTVVAPKESVRHADLPVLPEGVRRTLSSGPEEVVVDVGGDPTGARVLGGLRDALPSQAKGLFVVNRNRPFSRTIDEALDAVDKIASSTGLSPSAIVANTHLAEETTVDHVADGTEFARELGGRLSIPVAFLAAPLELKRHEDEITSRVGDLPILWLKRFMKKPWEDESQ